MAINDIYRKSTKKYKFSFSDANGPVDITNWKIYFVAKRDIDDSDANAAILVSTVAGDESGDDLQGGIMYLVLSVNDTDIIEELYHYQFVRVIPGALPDVRTLDIGTFSIIKSVIDVAT